MATQQQVRAHRRDLRMLTDLAEGDLRVLFRGFGTAEDARDGLMDVLPRLVAVYGSAAATLAADWYDDLRESAEVRGRFRAVVAELPDAGRTDALARWGVTPLFAAEPDFGTALTKVSGGLQRVIADADRQTVAASSVADPAAQGWQRTGAGECDFCADLIGSGNVHSVASTEFASHDHCGCTATVIFDT